MNRITFENGTLVSPAKVTIDGIDYPITPAVWQGRTPISAYVLNLIQQYIETGKINIQTITTETNLNSFTSTGVYGIKFIANTYNGPSTNWGILFVFGTETTGTLCQIFLDDGPECNAYKRGYSEGSWSNWTRFAKETDFTTIRTTATIPDNVFSTIDQNLVVKTGKTVHVAFRGLLSTDIGADRDLLTLPHVSALGTSGIGNIGAYGGEYTTEQVIWGYLQDGNKVRIQNVPSGKWVHINFSYATD